jgi:iron complex outermembrane recepter protein
MLPLNPSSMPFRPHALALAVACALTPAAWAQSSAGPSTAPAADETQTIVITAGKRPEKQREVAGTVSVVQGADLERRGAKDQEDIFKLTPGVQFTKGDPSTAAVTIRGLGSSGCSICGGLVQSPTGFYLEDVPLTDPFGSLMVVDIAPFDLERIEVLRGPQGALYGSASLGGAVRYLLAKPNAKGMDASVMGSLSSVSGGAAGYGLNAMVNAPLGSTAALRVVAFDRKDGGYVDNLGTGKKDANELRQRGGRVMLGLQPVKGLDVQLIAMTQTTDNDDGFAVSPDPRKLEQNTPSASPRKGQFDFYNLQLNYDLGGNMLTSNTGHYKKYVRTQYDSTRIYGNVGAAFGQPPLPLITAPGATTQDSTSQELRLASKPGAALSYVVGAFWQRVTYDSAAQILAPGGQALWGAFGPVLLANDVVLNSTGSMSSTEKALFADGEYALGAGWSVGLGARAYRTQLNYKTAATFFGNPILNADQGSKESGTTPKASVKYKFGDNLWYASASKGYRFGGVNAVAPFKPYSSDSLWSYETGLRLTPSRDLQIDLSVFTMDWSKAQVSAYDTSGAVPVAITANVGKARNNGLEAALQYRISREFNVNAALAYIDAKTAADFPSGAIPGSVIPSGSRLPSTPKLQAALQGNYSFAGPLGTQGRFNATYSYTGDRVLDIDGFNKTPSYDAIDLGLSFARENWTLAATLANAADKRGVVGIIGGTPGLPYVDSFVQRPRTLTVSLRWDM